MRPINKGESPYKKINEYKDALPYLERRIGMYCSYCEFSIPHVPEVEHVVSKSKGGDLTDWNNLNLGCKYCNIRKKAQTMPENKKNYLWPDEDNTAIAYSYINGIPKVNEELLIKLDSTGDYLKRARNTYKLVGLGNLPMGKDRDRRFGQRNTAYQKALNSLEHWNHMKDLSKEYQNDMKNSRFLKLGVFLKAYIVSVALERAGRMPQGELGEKLKQQENLALYRYMNQDYALQEIGEVFTEKQIPFLPLKGSVLREEYPEPWLRTSGDIDILVHEQDVKRASQVLMEICGFSREGGDKKDISFMRDECVHVKLHRNLIRTDLIQALQTREIWAHAAKSESDYRYEMAGGTGQSQN